MYVLVTFLGLHRAQARTDHIRIPLIEKTRVIDILTHLKKLYPDLPFPEDAILVSVNDKISSMERILENEDNVTFLPFLGGG